MGGKKTKSYMTYEPDYPLSKAELMAVEMRKCKKRDLIASKRVLRNHQATEQQPLCAMSGRRMEYPSIT